MYADYIYEFYEFIFLLNENNFIHNSCYGLLFNLDVFLYYSYTTLFPLCFYTKQVTKISYFRKGGTSNILCLNFFGKQKSKNYVSHDPPQPCNISGPKNHTFSIPSFFIKLIIHNIDSYKYLFL